MAKSELILSEGEEVLGVLEGEMFATSTNFVTNIIMQVVKFIYFIFGCRKTAQLTITNKRVVCETHTTVCYVFPSAAYFSTILPHGIASVDYAFQATFLFCLCRKCVVIVTKNSGAADGFIVKAGIKEAARFADLIFKAITR